jgi:hypothetical protein
VRCVWEGAGRWVVRFLQSTLGEAVPDSREAIMTVCQVAVISAATLILPCTLIDLAFDTDFLSMLMQALLAAFALALTVAVWTGQEE